MVVNVYVSAVTTDNISRHELLAWVNSILQAQLSKIEEMGSGAAYCQLTHSLFPDAISLKKVKWNSKSEMDWINNWKILGLAWKALGVDKPVQVEKLVKSKFQDNFEFLQWFYKFYNQNLTEFADNYDAIGARGGEPFPASGKGPSTVRSTVTRPAVSRPAPAATRAAPAPAAAAVRKAPLASSNGVPKSNGADQALIADLKQQLEEANAQVETAETERDFYYQKLLAVETYCNENEAVSKERILQILYAENGTEAPIENPEPAAEAAAPAPVAEVQAVTAEAAAVSLDDSETF